jgi:HAMP domain-containing protein
VREPSWSSPLLAASRFDGQAEVDRIVDLALRIRSARVSLGLRPAGTAAEYWDRQSAALEAAALRLGHRADALIRYRDQAALLSAELRQLADLERLERSAAEVDGITAATSALPGRGDGDLRRVADEVAAVRGAVAELVELMTRTRAPLAEPTD